MPIMAKIDIHNTDRIYETALENFKTDEDMLLKNRETILRFISDAELGKTIQGRAKKKIGKRRILKYISMFRTFSKEINKPFEDVTQADMEAYIRKLENSDYKESTQVDYKKAIRKLYKWLLGNNQNYPELVSWFDTSLEKPEIPALSRDEIEKMVSLIPYVKQKAMVMMLFDSGARIEEFFNIKMKHLTKKEDYYQIRIEFSKTKPRTISLPLSTALLNDWLREHPDKDNPEAQLFPCKYGTFRIFLRRAGQRILKKNVHPHLLRHSSATYYCSRLNQYQLCYRYGWSMASSQPARYIDREGLNEEETARKIKSDEVSTMKELNQDMKEQLRLMRAELDERKKYDEILNVLFEDKTILDRLKKKILL